jgi:site-specific recombinase XerD
MSRLSRPPRSTSSSVGCRGVSAGTQHRRQREVKAFFSWCCRMGYINENPFGRFLMMKREQKVVQPFLKEDVARLLDAADTITYVGCRMRTMILWGGRLR